MGVGSSGCVSTSDLSSSSARTAKAFHLVGEPRCLRRPPLDLVWSRALAPPLEVVQPAMTGPPLEVGSCAEVAAFPVAELVCLWSI
jgi:hypothetical protein